MKPLSVAITLLFLSNFEFIDAQIIINEILTSNASINTDPDYNEYTDWIELYNAGNTDVDLTGYHLTDNISDTLKWTFPAGTNISAHDVLLVWTDGKDNGLHTSYSLSRSGEELGLYDAAGNLLDALVFTEQKVDISYGRATNGGTPWVYFIVPTPAMSNNNSTGYNGFTLHEPVFSVTGGFFDTGLTVAIDNLDNVGQLYYTTDGSYPTLSSNIYTAPINISQTTVVKARLIESDMISGPVVTNTYFINEGFEDRKLPVLSLSTDPAYFWDPAIGLYVQDFKPEWEYPVHLEFYEADGLPGFHHDAGIRIDGENSWILPQKMMAVSCRKQYETGGISYQIFPEISRTEFDNLTLRCSGNDWSNTFFRDVLQHYLTEPNSDLDFEYYRPCIVYVNGEYLGLHNIRPKEDAEYIEQKYHFNADSVDIIINNGEIDEGDDVRYQELMTQLNNGVQSAADFEELETIMDISNFTDYIIAEIFGANESWGHNIACWRSKSDTARFRWFLHDFDRGFNMDLAGSTAMEFFTATNGASWSNPAWATLPLRKMLQNNDYRNRFITRFADHLYTTYHPVTINQRVDYHSDRIRNEMPIQIARWAGTSSSYGDAIPSMAYWENEVQQLKVYAGARNNYLYQNINDFFGLEGISSMNLQVSAAQHGFIKLHDIPVSGYPWSGSYFDNLPIQLTAVPKAGHQFVHWEKSTVTQTSILDAGATWKYSDAISAPPSDWFQPAFDDAAWSTGAAELGYGDSDENTVLDYGNNANNKTVSYYFRQQFNVNDPAAFSNLQLKLIADDGAVVYINGNEVLRYNMPSGNIGFNTLATSTIGDATEYTWQEFSLPGNILQSGNNVIAVTVHQVDVNSSDISFDLSLSGSGTVLGGIYSTDAVIDFELLDEGISLKAVFEPTGECFLPDTILTDLTLVASCSPYIAQGDVVIPSNITLTIEPGVEIRFPEDAAMWINGSIQAGGTADAEILFTATPVVEKWNGLFFVHSTATSLLEYVTIEKASAGTNRVYYPAAISAYDGDIDMNQMTITNVFDNPVFTRQSDITMTNSIIHSTVTGDCINVKNGYAYIENSEFYGDDEIDMDAIDYDNVIDGVVRNCIIHDFRGENNDGMDIGEESQNLLIENNLFYNCVDKGISVGQESSAIIKNNTIAWCALGMGLKDRSVVTIDHNTIHATGTGISAYEKNPGYRGGVATIINTIVSNSSDQAFFADTTAELNISYSINDTEILEGDNNSSSNPHFSLPNSLDFHLQGNSPAIGAGSDNEDIGTTYFSLQEVQPKVMISEIYYNDTESGEAEFLELYNPGTEPVDLSGYTISEAVNFVFSEGVQLLPDQYLVVAENTDYYPGGNYQVAQWESGQLSNNGERILLTDANGILMDFVRYDVTAPWPDSSVTDGHSLELISSDLDNHFYSSWLISATAGGSPGEAGIVTLIEQPVIKELFIFPNPVQGNLQVSLQNESCDDCQIVIYNILGQPVYTQKNALFQGNISEKIDCGSFPSGIYFLTISSATDGIILSGSFEKI